MADLAPYAISPRNTRGRARREKPPVGRSEFQRDRDRIIHRPRFAGSNPRRRSSSTLRAIFSHAPDP